jgi:hypothetical protein
LFIGHSPFNHRNHSGHSLLNGDRNPPLRIELVELIEPLIESAFPAQMPVKTEFGNHGPVVFPAGAPKIERSSLLRLIPNTIFSVGHGETSFELFRLQTSMSKVDASPKDYFKMLNSFYISSSCRSALREGEPKTGAV